MPSFGPEYPLVRGRVYLAAERLCARKTDIFVSVGRELADRYVGADIGRPEQYRVIRSPVDIDRFVGERGLQETRRREVLRRHALDPDRRVGLVISALDKRKRVDLILTSLAAPLRRGLQVIVLGDGPDREALERLVATLGVQRAVHLPGFVEDVAPYLGAADVLVHASTIEGVPQTIVQAHAAGLPVVATEALGIREVPGPLLLAHANGDGLAVRVAEALRTPRSPVDSRLLAEWTLPVVEQEHLQLLRDVSGSRAARLDRSTEATLRVRFARVTGSGSDE
jgi:glycosyltransferase involved in cell wall biosynthesis